MDIDLLSKMVAELILDNDEVALPGVGSFIAEFVPSTFSDRGYTINPPYRRLSFRQKESSDTKLIDFYASKNHLDSRTAASILTKFLLEMREILMTKKTIVFPGLGRLRATKENNFFFVPDEDLNIYPEGFGLEPVSLKTHVETDDEVQAAVENLHSILEPLSSPVAESEFEPVVPVVEAEKTAEVEPAFEPEHASPVDTMPALGREMATEPAAELESVGSKPVLTQEAASAPATIRPDKAETQSSGKKAQPKKAIPAGWKVLMLVAVAAVLFFILFFIVSRLAPDFIDKILYNAEELELIRIFKL